MICISIAQSSRRLALVDMYNAGPQCDLIEVRLDRFDNAANVGELLANRPKPVIMTCRRPEDGGDWQGGEPERLALLRQCVIDKADYVEIELDVADQVRPLPPAKRVISYTNLVETPEDLPEIYAQALTKNPDVVKLVVPVHSPEEVWPVVQTLGHATVPTVVVGLGQPGVMLALMARKMGAPWTYAALERGMEAHSGQTTVADLEEVYHHRSIQKGTPLVGVTGFGELPRLNVALLNAALAGLGVPTRCLPLAVGDLQVFRKVLKALRLGSVVIDREHQSSIRAVVPDLKASARQAEAVDFLTYEEDKWQGYNLSCRAAMAALEAAVGAKPGVSGRSAPNSEEGASPLAGRVVMLVGVRPVTRVLAAAVQQADGIPVIAGRDADAAKEMAGGLGCRFVRLEAVYSTLHEVLVRCDDSELHPGYLKAGMTVLDLPAPPEGSPLLREAEDRGAAAVSPRQVMVELVARQARAITGQDVSREPLLEAWQRMVEA
jgi:3-dehydroquinate dehydratase/shikimate dehydrogenase